MSRLSKVPTQHHSNQFHSLAAYLLLGLGGNDSPSASDITELLKSVGVDPDTERLEKLISELKGKDINEVRAQQLSQFDSYNHLLTLHSSSLRVPQSSPLSHLVDLVVEPPLLLPVVLPQPLRPPRRKRKKRRRRNPTTTWDSDCLTKCTLCVDRYPLRQKLFCDTLATMLCDRDRRQGRVWLIMDMICARNLCMDASSTSSATLAK